MTYGVKGLFSRGIAADEGSVSLRVAREKTGGIPINFPEPRLREFGAGELRRGR
jgi:hypothetical protein